MDVREDESGVTLRVRVKPRASREEIAGVKSGALEVRLRQPPVDGKANAALVRFLALLLGVAPGAVEIVGGAKAREKIVRVRGVRRAQIEAVLPRGT